MTPQKLLIQVVMEADAENAGIRRNIDLRHFLFGSVNLSRKKG